MQGMSSEHAEVRKLLGMLTTKFAECSDNFDTQAVGNSLYGLQGMNSEHAEVRKLLTILTPKVAGCVNPLNSQAIGNALYGLQFMSSEHAEVGISSKCLIRTLYISLHYPTLPALPLTVSNQSLPNLRSSSHGFIYRHNRTSSSTSSPPPPLPQVCALFDALSGKIAEDGEVLGTQNVGNVLYGLRSASVEHTSVTHPLDTVYRCIVVIRYLNIFSQHTASSSSIKS